MEPFEPVNYIREQALALAVQHAQGRIGFTSRIVIDIADEFLNWLNNE